MALTRVSGRVVYPHGEDTPTPVTGDGVIEYAHASPGVIGEAVHGPDRHRIEYVDGVAGEAWLKAGMWRAYVYPSEGRSYTLHLGIPEGGDVTLADVVGEVVPEGIVTRGEQGDPGASVVGGRDNGDGTVSFELSDGTFTDPVVLPPGPAGRGIASISDPDADSRVTITFTDDTTTTVQAIRGADGHSPVITWDGTTIVTDGTPGPDLKGEPGDPGPASTVPGPANVLSIGTVTSGETASATITGTSPAQVLSLVLPKGEKGDPGAGGTATLPDTGWRDVTGYATAIVTGGTIRVRRIGNVVYWRFSNLATSGGGEIITDAAVMRPFGQEATTVWPPHHPGTFFPVWTPGQALTTPQWVFVGRSTSFGNGFVQVSRQLTSPRSGEGSYVSDRPFPSAPYPGTPA